MKDEKNRPKGRFFTTPRGIIRVIKPEAFLAATAAVDNGEFGSFGSDAFELLQQETEPLDGYKEEENFPECCDYHKDLYKAVKEKYESFPDCCEPHKQLRTAWWFNKSDYNYLPQKLLKTSAYSWHCILENINADNWQKAIKDYIIYTKESYGQFPEGYGPPLGKDMYLHILERRLEGDIELPSEKRAILLEMVKGFSKPSTENVSKNGLPDLNRLVRIYREWINIFPFELSFFQHLKVHFEQQLPLVGKMSEPNIYTNEVSAKLKSEMEVLDWLNKLTESILHEINTLRLHEQGELKDATGIQLELLLAGRRQKLKEGYSNASPDAQTRYRRIVKDWLKDEKKFIKELIPLVRDKENSTPTSGEKVSTTPIFNEQAAADFFEIVKTFFLKKHQVFLQNLLNGKKPKEKLLFLDSGNKLADALKQLFEANFITGCQKKDLERWILDHFEYQSRGDVKSFKARSLSDIISSNKDKCSTPLINVTKDKVTGRYTISQP